MRYALDTNTVILLLRNDQNVSRLFHSALEKESEIAIPPLVHYEIRRGFLCGSSPKREESYDILIEQCPIREMDIDSLECAANIYANLYREKLTMDDADLLIAAFCLTGGYTLVTNNTKHFAHIAGLKTEDWRQTTL